MTKEQQAQVEKIPTTPEEYAEQRRQKIREGTITLLKGWMPDGLCFSKREYAEQATEQLLPFLDSETVRLK